MMFKLGRSAGFEELFLRFIPRGSEMLFSFSDEFGDTYFTVKLDVIDESLVVFLPDKTILWTVSLGRSIDMTREISIKFKAFSGFCLSVEVNNQVMTTVRSLKFGNLKEISRCRCSSQTIQILEASPQIIEDDIFSD
ncbi:hypothetical protein QR680_013693 [Steinernema hermaphroditum]|uniref:Uncharacterized protein n=1 Tax=Steinernema hermaphroditum TaxID=289476 RepID=A0AA39I6D5_9BILA|nr:hypothetical protein QR680_013693 [Steinernema hermaphroditum]